jgi:hypothetical protein
MVDPKDCANVSPDNILRPTFGSLSVNNQYKFEDYMKK